MNEKLRQMGACEEGLDWLGDKPLEAAWAECHRGDWMLWVSSRVGVDIKTLTNAKVRCARLVQHLMKDQRSLDALVVAEAFAGGTATRAQLNAAAYAAYAAVAAAVAASSAAYAVAAATAAAAYAVAYAADAAYASVAAVAAASSASYAYAVAYDAYAAASYASAAADADAARKKTQHQCAEICRDTIPLHDVLRLIKEQSK